MLKKNNNFSNLIIFIIVNLFFYTNCFALENKVFLSLKNNEVNLRQGPAFDYPVKLKYKKKYLPVIIIDKFETWRKIKDFENNSGWIHISQLSKKNSAININNNSVIYKRPTVYSRPIAK